MKYKFNNEIETKLKSFKIYLQEIKNSENTIRQKLNYTGCFLKWLESEKLEAKDVKYNDMLSFVDYCNLENQSKKLINNKLRSIRNFYDYLKLTNPNIINPANNLHLKGITRKIPINIINFQELEKLYQTFEITDNRSKRNKAILGLLIYQAVTTEELHRLEPIHLQLQKGKIYVPGNRKRNSRLLELKPFQILELQEYITEIRPKLLQQETTLPAEALAKVEQLFISMEGNLDLKNTLHHLFRAIKKRNPNIVNAKQIRQSRITYLLKTCNLRQIQYFAGHKYVSSTERYQLNNLDNLKSKLEKYHPLNHPQ